MARTEAEDPPQRQFTRGVVRGAGGRPRPQVRNRRRGAARRAALYRGPDQGTTLGTGAQRGQRR